MTEDIALMAAVRANPDDDTPRLVFADWLDEHEQEKRAEYLRLSVELLQLCGSVDAVVQTYILALRLDHLKKLRDGCGKEWIAVVDSPRFEFLFLNEQSREVARRQQVEEAKRKAAEKERLRAEREVAERRDAEYQKARVAKEWSEREQFFQQERSAWERSHKRALQETVMTTGEDQRKEIATLKKEKAEVQKQHGELKTEHTELKKSHAVLQKHHEAFEGEAGQWYVGQWIGIAVLAFLLFLTNCLWFSATRDAAAKGGTPTKQR